MRSLLRYALVAFVSALAATATVGGAVLAHNDGFNERIVACFDSRDPNSDECLAALDVSPVDADFYSQLAANLTDRPAPTPEPKKTKTDLYSLLKECADSGDIASDECQRALEATGLSEDDFRAKIAAKLGVELDGDVATSGAMRACLDLRASINGKSVEDLAGMAEKINAVCVKALRESHMSAGDFWRRYR